MANIPFSQLKTMFHKMKYEAGWNTAGPLLWGYFFTDPDRDRLKPLATHLTSLGYRLVNLYPTDDRSTHFLHVERIEVHTPKSLDQRNRELNEVAAEFEVKYDGMDVGPIPSGVN